MGGPVFDALRGDGSEAQKIGAAVLLAGAWSLRRWPERGCWKGGRSHGRSESACCRGFLLWGCSLLTEGKVGRGDGDMVLILGLFLGWRRCVVALCAACLLSALWAGIGLAAGRLKKDSKLPFAPFLLAAVALAGLSGF